MSIVLEHLRTQVPDNFRPLLAAKIEDEADYKRLQAWPYMVSPKLDGIRTLLHPNYGAVTRKIKALPNAYVRALLGIAMNEIPEAQGLDGELTYGEVQDVTKPDTFNKSQSAFMSQGGKPKAVYWVFDSFCLHVERFEDRYHHLVNNIFPKLLEFSNRNPDLMFVMVPHYHTPNLKDLMEREQSFVEQGFEGIMIRKTAGKYKYGRSTLIQQDLIKVKRWSESEGVIIGFEELQHNNNTDEKDAFGLSKRSSHKENMIGGNTLGNLILKVINGPYKGVTVKVGSGFTAHDRDIFWKNQDKLLHGVVTFKWQKSGAKDAPRFPIYKGVRAKDDMDAESGNDELNEHKTHKTHKED